MAQEFSKKLPSRFQPELDANELASYTTHILVNRKYFPEEVQQTIVPRIIDLVLLIAEKTNEANEICVKASLPKEELKANYEKRIKLEGEVLSLLHKFKMRIKTLKLGYHLAKHKANSWNREVNKTIVSITSWRNGEIKKFREL